MCVKITMTLLAMMLRKNKVWQLCIMICTQIRAIILLKTTHVMETKEFCSFKKDGKFRILLWAHDKNLGNLFS